MGTLLDLTGETFGLLVAVRRSGHNSRNQVLWYCECHCGGSTIVPTGALRSGNTKSCGCRKRSVLGESTTKHGLAGTRTYRIFNAMHSRVKSHHRYENINICERWSKFENFVLDMGMAPDGLTLDRIDGTGDYSPENCRWATPKEQARNLRTNRLITYRGVTMCLSAWAESAGKDASWLWKRLKRKPFDEAMAPFAETVFFDPEM